MNIPHLYVYLTSETVIVLIAITVLLFLKNKKLSKLIEKLKDIISELKANSAMEEASFDLSNDYSDYLNQELERNQAKIKTLDTIPLDDEDNEVTTKNEHNKSLLTIREDFLNLEKTALDHNEDENTFWNSLYNGIQGINDKHFTQIENTVTEEVIAEKIVTTSPETILQIEPQGKKIDAEVNKLKDIIYDQENSLSALSKALQEAAENHEDSDTTETLDQLQEKASRLERNIEESKVCMEILETENDRLQGELAEFESKYNQMCEQLESGSSQATSATETQPNENIDQLKNVLEQQDQQISELTNAVDNLQLEAEQAEQLKQTLQEFTRGSQEMQTCITILEEENERLLEEVEELKNASTSAIDDTDSDTLNQKIDELEQELIKKDVAYAKLQDEYLSMEKEYLTMYEEVQSREQSE